MLICSLRLWFAVRRERPVTDQEIAELLEDCKMQMGVQTIVGVVVTDKVKSPALFGFVRPRLLLPEGLLEALSLDELHHVFLHELAHLRRRDIYTSWWAAVLQIAHWFNPLIWFAFRRMRADQEMAADALVLRQMAPEEPPAYGRTIVGLLERFSQPHYVPSVAGILEEPSHIERRMTMIARFKQNSRRRSAPGAIVIFLAACISLTDAQQVTKQEVVSPVTPKPSLRQIEVSGPGRVHGRPSFDGRYMSGVDAETNDLVLRDIDTGQEWRLTSKDPASGDFADRSAISPDSTKVVYYWFNLKKEDFDIRVVALDGSNDRLLWAAQEGAAYFNMDAWSPDSKYVYGELLRGDEPVRLVRVSIADGSRAVIKTFDHERFFTVCPSPNGRYLAYDCAENESANRDIFVHDLQTGQERTLVRHAANDKLLGWTPEGGHVFFASDRNGTWDGWLLPVEAGRGCGVPEMIKAGLGDVVPVGFTRDGAFYYKYEHSGWNVYTALLDEERTEIVDKPEPVRQLGKDGFPDWSPDGRYLAYFAQPDRDKPTKVRIRTLATGQEREIEPDIPNCKCMHWCPDSRHLLLTDVAGQSAVYKLDVSTGRHSTLVLNDEEEAGARIRQAELAADGNTLAYRVRGRGNANRLVIKDLGSGQEKELLRTEAMGDVYLSFASGWALSPDGSKVALCVREGGPDAPLALKIMSVESGACTTVIEDGAFQVAWPSIGGDLLLSRHLRELWLVSSTGQTEARMLLEWRGPVFTPRLHPDGRHLAFFSGTRVSELWAMENFLPETDSALASESTTSSAVSQPAFTKIRIPNKIHWDAQLSPDGENILFVSDQKLWLMPRSGRAGSDLPGEARMLDTGGVAVEWCGLTWSGDGRWIAFNGAEVHEGRQKIYVVPSGGGTPRQMYENNRDARIVNYRMSLSPDGQTLAFTQVDANELHIYTMPVDGGPPKQLVEAPAREPAFSPDGTKIAYVRDRGLGRAGGGLWVVPAAGGNPTLVADGTNATSPIWSPSGHMLAFIDDGRIHIVAPASGASTLDTEVTIDGLGGLDGARRLAGWTLNNQIGVVFEKEMEFALYSQAVQGGKPTFVTYGGYPTQPRWSPDGERIFYVKNANDQSTDWVGHAIAYVPARGGAVHTVALNAESKIRLQGIGTGNHISPDGRTIVFAGHKAGQPINTMHIWTLVVEGGTPQQLTDAPAPFRDWYPCWSPDGQRIAFVRMKASANWAEVGPGNIFTVPASGGQPRQITTEADGVFSFGPVTWSPNGKLFAYFSRDGKGTSDGAIKIIGTEGGEPRVVTRVQKINANKEMAWSPDGKRIAYNAPDNKINIVSIEDGDIEETVPDIQEVHVYHLDWSPDGKKLVFAGAGGGGPEFWMVDNFLPEAVASAEK